MGMLADPVEKCREMAAGAQWALLIASPCPAVFSAGGNLGGEGVGSLNRRWVCIRWMEVCEGIPHLCWHVLLQAFASAMYMYAEFEKSSPIRNRMFVLSFPSFDTSLIYRLLSKPAHAVWLFCYSQTKACFSSLFLPVYSAWCNVWSIPTPIGEGFPPSLLEGIFYLSWSLPQRYLVPSAPISGRAIAGFRRGVGRRSRGHRALGEEGEGVLCFG